MLLVDSGECGNLIMENWEPRDKNVKNGKPGTQL